MDHTSVCVPLVMLLMIMGAAMVSMHILHCISIIIKTDINECLRNSGRGLCQQYCTNTVGSFYCTCNSGYTLAADGLSCNGMYVLLTVLS